MDRLRKYKQPTAPSARAITSRAAVCAGARRTPLFPYDFRNDVCIQCTVMSVDYDCSPEVAAMIGASACVSYSEIPFAGQMCIRDRWTRTGWHGPWSISACCERKAVEIHK